MSPSTVALVNPKDKKNYKVVKKLIDKNKLFGQFQLPQARKECAIQSIFKHKHIAQMYEYAENDNEIVLFMEYCNDP